MSPCVKKSQNFSRLLFTFYIPSPQETKQCTFCSPPKYCFAALQHASTIENK